MPPAAAPLLFRGGHHRCRGRPRAHHERHRAARHQRQRRTGRQLPPQENRCRHRAFSLVRSQAHALTRSLEILRSDLLAIVRAALSAVDAGRLVDRALNEPVASLDADIWILAAGKAAPSMASAALAGFPRRIRGGLIVDREGPAPGHLPGALLEHIVGGHPVPTTGSERAGRRALDIAARMDRDEVLLLLLSGGASALMAAPVEWLTLSD